MAPVTVLVDPAIRSAVVREEHQASVVALRSACEQVEDAVIVKQEVLGVAILGPNYIGPLNRVSAEEDGLVYVSTNMAHIRKTTSRSSNRQCRSCLT